MSENVNQENKQEQENTDTPETQPQQEPSPETAEETQMICFPKSPVLFFDPGHRYV